MEKKDVEEYYYFYADVTSNTKRYFELDENAKLTISIGDEVKDGKTIAYLGEKPIKIDKTGIIEDINYSDGKIIIMVLSFDDLIYKCKVKPDMVYLFEDNYVYQEEKKQMKVQEVSNIMEDGYLNVYVEVPKENEVYYGQTIDNLKIYTGTIFSDVSVINKSCVYKKGDLYCVRSVTEEGDFIEEINVKIGMELDDSICVYGINEGVYCDGGYKGIVNGEENEIN